MKDILQYILLNFHYHSFEDINLNSVMQKKWLLFFVVVFTKWIKKCKPKDSCSRYYLLSLQWN